LVLTDKHHTIVLLFLFTRCGFYLSICFVLPNRLYLLVLKKTFLVISFSLFRNIVCPQFFFNFHFQFATRLKPPVRPRITPEDGMLRIIRYVATLRACVGVQQVKSVGTTRNIRDLTAPG